MHIGRRVMGARAFRYAVLHCVVEVTAAAAAADRSFQIGRTDGRTAKGKSESEFRPDGRRRLPDGHRRCTARASCFKSIARSYS